MTFVLVALILILVKLPNVAVLFLMLHILDKVYNDERHARTRT